MSAPPPLIITLSLDKPSQDYFTELRNQYYPRYCNQLDAHLTLFHHLPSDLPGIAEILQTAVKRKVIGLQVTGVGNTGNGVAFKVVSEELLQLHKEMQLLFEPHLRSKDKTELWPHITVQNRVTAYKAKQTQEMLMKDFKPFSIQGIGLATWLYLKGPWQALDDYLFKAA
jgi:hypothetical protein